MLTVLRVIFSIPLLVLSAMSLYLAVLTVRWMSGGTLRKGDMVVLRRAESPVRFWLVGVVSILVAIYVFFATAWIALGLILNWYPPKSA